MRKNNRPGRLDAVVLCAVALWCLLACDGNTWVHRYRAVGEDGWAKGDTLLFALPAADSSGLGLDCIVCARVTPAFPYRNLWMGLQYDLACPDTSYVDTVCYAFTDSLGQMGGHGVTLLQFEQDAAPVSLKPGQEGSVRVYHLMKKEIIPEIREVGIRMVRRPSLE